MMFTRMQNIYDYTGYIKCGEILRPPCESTTRPYALKCFYCKEIYLLFEAFIFHIEDHCKNAIANVEHDTVNMESVSTDQNSTAQNQKYCAHDNEDEKTSSFVQTEEASVVIKSDNTSSDDNQPLLVKKELKSPADTKTNRSTLLRSESQLNKYEQLNYGCDTKKLPQRRRALEKSKNNTTKPTIVAKDNVKKKAAKKPINRVVKVDNKDEFKFKSCEKKVHQQSSKKTNCKTTSIEEEPKNNADDNLLSGDHFVNEINSEYLFGNTYICPQD